MSLCTHIRLLITAPYCDPRNSPIIIMSYLTLCREKLEIQPTRRLSALCISFRLHYDRGSLNRISYQNRKRFKTPKNSGAD